MQSTLAKIEKLKTEWPKNIALQCFDASYFQSLDEGLQQRLLKCINSGVENPDSEMGCYANQPSDYDDLRPFFSKALSSYHRVSEQALHENNWSLDNVEGLPEDRVLNIEKLGLPALSMRVRVGRNLADFPLPGAMTKQERIALEKRMMSAFNELITNPAYGGSYYSLTPGNPNQIDDAEYDRLVNDHIMFKNMDDDAYLAAAGISADWPYGRGCYVSQDRCFIVWVGEEDHLRIMCMAKGTVLNDVFDRLKQALKTVETIDGLKFAQSSRYGYVTSCPTNLGTGMRASVHIQLPNLTRDGNAAKAKEVARPLGLSVRGAGGEHTPVGADGTVDISPSARFCITEAEIITSLYKGLSLLKSAEDGGNQSYA